MQDPLRRRAEDHRPAGPGVVQRLRVGPAFQQFDGEALVGEAERRGETVDPGTEDQERYVLHVDPRFPSDGAVPKTLDSAFE